VVTFLAVTRRPLDIGALARRDAGVMAVDSELEDNTEPDATR
jgi:hypothetical protein